MDFKGVFCFNSDSKGTSHEVTLKDDRYRTMKKYFYIAQVAFLTYCHPDFLVVWSLALSWQL